MDKEIYVNISFDDLHPEKGWGAMNDKWLEELSNFKEKWSDIKYTFFTTPNFEGKDENEYISLIKRRMHLLGLRIPLLKFKKQENNKFLISKYPEWIHFIKKQTAESFFEICIHGNTHYQRYVLPHAEFDRLSKEQNLEKIHDAVKIFQTNGIKFTYCFRPPARGVNKTLKESLIENGFKYLSLEPRQTTLSFEKENGIFNIPQNYSIESSTFDNVFQHLQKHNYLFIKGHIFEKLENGIREETLRNLSNLLIQLAEKYKVTFIHIHEIEKLYNDNTLQNVKKI